MPKPNSTNLSIHPDLGIDLPTDSQRLARAFSIIDNAGVIRIEDDADRLYAVKSQSTPDHAYFVTANAEGVSCDCPDPVPECKHALAVYLYEQSEAAQAWEGFKMDDERETIKWLALFADMNGGAI